MGREDLELRDRILLLGGEVEAAIDLAMQALVDRDSELALRVLHQEDQIDACELGIDQKCIELLTHNATGAQSFRFILTAARVTPILERIADEACKIARLALQLNQEPQLRLYLDLRNLGQKPRRMLGRALDAYAAGDASAAYTIMDEDQREDFLDHRLYRELFDSMSHDQKTAGRAARLFLAAKHLERIGDYVADLCELVIDMTEARAIKHSRRPQRNRAMAW